MRKHKSPSEKQLKAIALKAANPQMSNMEAALQAGYKPSVAKNAKREIFDKPLVKTWLDNYRYTIEKAGLTQHRIASKLSELLDASYDLRDKKTGAVVATVPNQKLQLETIKVYHDIFGVNKGEGEKKDDGLKRRITLEEFEEKEGMVV